MNVPDGWRMTIVCDDPTHDTKVAMIETFVFEHLDSGNQLHPHDGLWLHAERPINRHERRSHEALYGNTPAWVVWEDTRDLDDELHGRGVYANIVDERGTYTLRCGLCDDTVAVRREKLLALLSLFANEGADRVSLRLLQRSLAIHRGT